MAMQFDFMLVRRRRSLIRAQGCFNPGYSRRESDNTESVRLAIETPSEFKRLMQTKPRVEATLGTAEENQTTLKVFGLH